MRKNRLFWQLYISSLLIIFLALFAFIFLTSYSFKSILLEQVSDDLIARASIMRNEVLRSWKQGDIAGVEEICRELSDRTETRVTLIRADGVVLADSWHDPATMDNHGDRPEILAAMQGDGRSSTSTRFSSTLQKNTMYGAIALRDQGRVIGVLRTAVPLQTVESGIEGLQLQILLGGIVIAFAAGFISLLISRRITRPIETLKQGARKFADGDLDFRMPVPRSEELSGLAEVMNNMAGQLQQRISQITQQHSQQDAVLSSMVEGVIAFDMDERLINVNHSAAKMLRINIERSKGKSIQEVVRNVGLQRFVEETLACESATEGFISLVDEIERFVQVHGSILRDEHDEPIGVVIVMNDYTELRNLENVRREFVANVSHELKTPITSIKGFVETLLDGALNDKEDAVRFLGIVSRQADRLNAIIEDLLSLSRIEQGSDQEQIELSVNSVYEVLFSAVQSCQMEAELKHSHIALDCDASLDALMNAPLLEQAIINLINNAIKYSDDGQTIAVTAVESADRLIKIAVVDKGYGIEAEHLPRLFERFYRIDKARSRKLGGTGLGLAIVKHIAQAHHGSVVVESAAGKGSTFTLSIPSGASGRSDTANTSHSASADSHSTQDRRS